jgi:DNA ligase 1
MSDLQDGESKEIKGSGSRTYVLRKTGGVYSCSCPAWMHQSFALERRTCKHLKNLRGEEAERLRVTGPLAQGTAAAAAAAPAPAKSASLLPSSGAPPLLLAHRWEAAVDPTGWWLSEKLDGVRAYWDGTKLLSRLGNTFVAPDWFLEGLPAGMTLDGELFAGRKMFQRAVSIVRRQDRSHAWKEISFVIFDAPSLDALFEARLDEVAAFIAKRSASHLRAHPHVRCEGIDHLRAELERVEALGGEGLMIRKAGSRYEVGRSSTLLKVKTFHDAEAVVVGHLPGTGKHKGRLGALECQLPNGTRFSVGTGFSDAERDHPAPIGSTITFRYQELTPDGVPRFPSYLRVRKDETPAAAPAAPAAWARVFTKGDRTWEITLTGTGHTIRQRRGLAVKTTSTKFDGAAAAWRDADAKIAAQLAEGFSEVVS